MPPKKRGQRTPPRKGAPARPARNSGPSGSPRSAGRSSPFYTPGASRFRRSVERTSAPLLVYLTSLPRPVVMFTPLVLILLGIFLPLAFGLVALGLFLVLTGWLAYLSWPRADGRARVIRILMFALVIALIAVRVARS